eukprot:SAG25_NODE_374_length_8940_cov_97.908155_6_plen_287_part_00
MLATWSAVLHELLGPAQMGAFAAVSPLSETRCCTVRVGTGVWTDKAEVDRVLRQLRRLGIASAAEYTVSTYARVGDVAQLVAQVVWRAAPGHSVSMPVLKAGATSKSVAEAPAPLAAEQRPPPQLLPVSLGAADAAGVAGVAGVVTRHTEKRSPPQPKKTKSQKRREQRGLSMLIDKISSLGVERTGSCGKRRCRARRKQKNKKNSFRSSKQRGGPHSTASKAKPRTKNRKKVAAAKATDGQQCPAKRQAHTLRIRNEPAAPKRHPNSTGKPGRSAQCTRVTMSLA